MPTFGKLAASTWVGFPPAPARLQRPAVWLVVPLCALALQCGRALHGDDEHTLPPLLDVVQFGRHDMASWILDRGESPVDVKDSNGLTPLYHAAVNGQLLLTQMLLDEGASMETTDSDGVTALYHATRSGYIQLTYELAKRGANTETTDPQGFTPLWRACQNAHSAIVETLLEFGASTEVADADGLTPLWHASKNGHPDIVDALLSYNASPSVRDHRSLTPFQVGIAYAPQHRARIAQLFLGRSIGEGSLSEVVQNYEGTMPIQYLSPDQHEHRCFHVCYCGEPGLPCRVSFADLLRIRGHEGTIAQIEAMNFTTTTTTTTEENTTDLLGQLDELLRRTRRREL